MPTAWLALVRQAEWIARKWLNPGAVKIESFHRQGKAVSVDPITPLITAGVTLAEKIIFSWYEKGGRSVRLSELEEIVQELARHEAERQSYEWNDLRSITERLLRTVIDESPYLAMTSHPFKGRTIELVVSESAREPSGQLLVDLKQRLDRIAEREIRSRGSEVKHEIETESEGVGDLSSQTPNTEREGEPNEFVILGPVPDPQSEEIDLRVRKRSREMIRDLERRVRDREDPRL
jgi:hypothetical protein